MKSTTLTAMTRGSSPMRKAALAAVGILLAAPLAGSPAAAAPAPDRHLPTSQAGAQAKTTTAATVSDAVERRTRKGRSASRNEQRAPINIRALAAARTRAGSPYAYGGSGPSSFDCSGLTSWAYAQVGKRLPHSSDAQAAATIRVSRPRPGDLVFFHNGGDVYHVGLWVSPGQVFHASQPGTPVSQARIWSGSIFFGRVR